MTQVKRYSKIGTMQSQRLFWTQILMFLWLKDQPYHKALSQSCLVITNLWGPLQITLKCKKSSQCKTRDCPSLIKNRRINQQKVLVFDNNNIKYNIIMGTNLLSKTGFKSNYSEGTWNGLITPSHFVHLEVWFWTDSMLWNACLTSKSKTSSLVKIDSNALQQRFWTPSIKRQM